MLLAALIGTVPSTALLEEMKKVSYPANQGPGLVAYNITRSGYEYLMRLIDLGIVEGMLGAMDLSPQVKEIFEALHVVAAGGDVKIEIKSRGNPDIVHELQRRIEQAGRDANEINAKAGYYLTAVP
ncbi:hypothetical protein WME99_44370 [Sorangium sp. So ce136]|uniref:hypothetical protein n=1 Tax=Sorangium sp. So ce136 TaxID=3133284 RepID=UPI003F07CA6C